MESKKLALLNGISFVSLLATFFLSIFFFIPYLSLPLEASKGILLSVGVTVSIFFWLLARLMDGKFTIPKDRIVLFAFFIPLVCLVSALFSSSPYLSLFGQGFETGTFGAMLLFFIILFLSSIYFQTEKRLSYFFNSLFIGAGILAAVEITSIFVNLSKFLPGIFQSISFGNLFGTWNDFALFFGGIIILALVTLELKPLKALSKIGLFLLVIAGLFFLAIVNTTFIWMMTGIFALIIFVYSISVHRAESINTDSENNKAKPVPVLAFIVVLVCLLFLIGSDSIGVFVTQYFGISNLSVTPSVSSTMHIAREVITHHPIVGTGPNTFVLDWSIWKPASLLQTTFWNADFTAGSGLIPTFAITTGILGILAWLLFLCVFVLRALQSLRVALKNTFSNYLIMSSFLLSLYFWIALLISTSNVVNVMIAFASTGVFLGVLVSKKVIHMYNGSFLRDPRTSFFSILALVVLMIASLSTTYIYAEKFTALIYSSRAQQADTTLPSLQAAEANMDKAILLDSNDQYYRALSQIYISEMNAVLSSKTLSQDEIKTDAQNLVTRAETSAQAAISKNPTYYVNWVNLGDIYSAFASIGVNGAYDNANTSYDKALVYAPSDVAILLSKSQLEIINKNTDTARALAEQALTAKPNYTDALFALAQIDQTAGNTTLALSEAKQAGTYAQNDPTVFFKLGTFEYNAGDYQDSVTAFETAVVLSPTYWTARYSLALAYQKVGRTDDASAQLSILHRAFPNDTTINSAILNGISSAPDTTTDSTSQISLPQKAPVNTTTKNTTTHK